MGVKINNHMNGSVDMDSLNGGRVKHRVELQAELDPGVTNSNVFNPNLFGESSDVKPSNLTPTPSQQQIISYPAQPNRILTIKAGPGSGKTFTVVKRIEFLIKNGIRPDEILVLSMTNRAVNSLRDKLTSLIGAELAQNVNVSTFHSFCASLVDNFGPLFFPNLTRKRLMDDLGWRNFSNIFLGKSIGVNGYTIKGNLTPSSLEKMLNGIKSGEMSVDEAASKNNVSKEYVRALLDYLDKNGIMRYQDFIIEALVLMEMSLKGPLIPQLENYKVVIVDEFQDMHYLLLNVVKGVVNYPTSEKSQNDAIETVGGDTFQEAPAVLGMAEVSEPQEVPAVVGMAEVSEFHSPSTTSSNIAPSKTDSFLSKHLSIAGDPNQCIYEFLGSKPDLIDNLHLQFPNATIDELSIQESFRLTPEILLASHKILRTDSSLKSMRPNLYKPIAYNTPSRSEEHQYIGIEITRLILELGGLLKPSDFIILCRSNKEIDDISEYFTHNFGFKCNKFSLTVPWIKSKVHILLDLLAVLNKRAGSDFGLLCTLLLIDKRYGSRARVSKLFTHFDKWRVDNFPNQYQENVLEDYLRKELDTNKSTLDKIFKGPDHTKTKKQLSLFLESIEMARKQLDKSQHPKTILETLQGIVGNLMILEYMNEESGDSTKSLEVHLASFYKSLEHSHKKFLKLEENESFVDFFLGLYNDDIPILDNDMVNISTIHSAKGLEFPVVFVPGCSQYSGQPFWESLLYDENTVKDRLSDEKNDKTRSEKTRLYNERYMSNARLFYVACTRAKSLLYIGTPLRLPELINKYFTSNKPVLCGDSLKKLAGLLERDLPSTIKIDNGAQLFQDLVAKYEKNSKNSMNSNIHRTHPQRNFQRNLHTSNVGILSSNKIMQKPHNLRVLDTGEGELLKRRFSSINFNHQAMPICFKNQSSDIFVSKYHQVPTSYTNGIKSKNAIYNTNKLYLLPALRYRSFATFPVGVFRHILYLI
jgi:ATP-dependent DNA helicase HMI1